MTERQGRLVDHAASRGVGRTAPAAFRNAIVAPLSASRRLVGTLLVADRSATSAPFDADDLKLFETLANHTAVALENGQLEQSLEQLGTAQGRAPPPGLSRRR